MTEFQAAYNPFSACIEQIQKVSLKTVFSVSHERQTKTCLQVLLTDKQTDTDRNRDKACFIFSLLQCIKSENMQKCYFSKQFTDKKLILLIDNAQQQLPAPSLILLNYYRGLLPQHIKTLTVTHSIYVMMFEIEQFLLFKLSKIVPLTSVKSFPLIYCPIIKTQTIFIFPQHFIFN